MKTKILLIFLLLIIASMNTASAGGEWVSNSSIVTGLGDVGTISCPIVFLDGSTLKLISGSIGGDFYGWQRSGSTWVSNSSIVTGLGEVGSRNVPTVFLDGSTLKLISGEYDGIFNGWYWSGSTWVSDPSIIAGLGDVGSRSTPTVFLDGSTFKLISGNDAGTFNGYYWSGSTWVSDPSIIAGLGDVGSRSSPTVFLDGSTFKLISTEYDSVFNGYYWSGSTWVSDSSIITGLFVVTHMHPTVFLDGSTLKLISGDYYGDFHGWYFEETFSISGTITDNSGAVNNAIITLNNSGGSTTSNEIGYYEITDISPNTYSINVTEVLHYDYSDIVTITSDTEENIFLTLISLEIVPIIAPPPVIPTEIPTPILIEETELTIFEESIEELSELSILITNLIGKSLTWAFLLATYIGAIASHLLIKGKDEEPDVLNVLLFGTLGWALLLLINFSGYITIVTTSFILNALIFGIAGFVVHTVLDVVTSKE